MKFLFSKLDNSIPNNFAEKIINSLPSNYEGKIIRETSVLMKEIQDADYFMGYPVPYTFIKKAKSLKSIFLLSSQVPESYQQWGGVVKNITGLNASSVANHGAYFVLRHLRERNLALDPKKLNLGIIGHGKIGEEMVAQLKPIFSNISVLSRRRISNLKSFNYDKREAFYQSQDIIIICVSYNRETRENFKEENFFKHLKSNIALINIARGELLSESDLLKYFQNNPDSRYYTDVTVPEPYPDNGELRKLSNIFITNHVAGFYDGLWDEIFSHWKNVGYGDL